MGKWLDAVMKQYLTRLRQEHMCRREGRWIDADFYLRQLTHIEMILDIGGRTQELIERFVHVPGSHPGVGGRHRYANPVSEVLEHKRREFWDQAGEPPRPPLLLTRDMPCQSLTGGGTIEGDNARFRARDQAEAMMKEAQAMWEATRTEESWAAWKAAKQA